MTLLCVPGGLGRRKWVLQANQRGQKVSQTICRLHDSLSEGLKFANLNFAFLNSVFSNLRATPATARGADTDAGLSAPALLSPSFSTRNPVLTPSIEMPMRPM